MSERIDVTRSFLPPMEEYAEYLKKIWENGYLTNQGPFLKDFEKALQNYLNIDNLHFVGNGTIALQVALRSLGITEGEVITTPFSYVATTSSILWERCKPVFVDINERDFCIDVKKIEKAITSETKAIMAVHVFGNPCDVDAIEQIARKHDIKVIYDAAHAFGVEYKGKSLLGYGDASTCSFHATKLYHTIEGGLIYLKDEKVSQITELIKRFGHNGDEHILPGLNAKASEFQAAMGLVNLKYVDAHIHERARIAELYDTLLPSSLKKPIAVSEVTKANHAYYPIVFDSETTLLRVIKKLNDQNIHPRRYFYPSLNKLPYIEEAAHCPVSETIASRILCLPLYIGIEDETITRISNSVAECLKD